MSRYQPTIAKRVKERITLVGAMQGVKKSWGGLPCLRDLRIALKEEVTRLMENLRVKWRLRREVSL